MEENIVERHSKGQNNQVESTRIIVSEVQKPPFCDYQGYHCQLFLLSILDYLNALLVQHIPHVQFFISIYRFTIYHILSSST